MNTNSDKKQTIVVDVDGTLYDDFKKNDNEIIAKMYPKNFLVKALDWFLWKINSLEIFANTMRILKLRLMIYSILNFSNYNETEQDYYNCYINFLYHSLNKTNRYIKLLENKYDIIFVTNNEYALCVMNYFYPKKTIYCKNTSERRKAISRLKNVKYIIGNNYTDDIKLAKRLNIKSVYVGKSMLLKNFKADYYAEDFISLVNILLNDNLKEP